MDRIGGLGEAEYARRMRAERRHFREMYLGAGEPTNAALDYMHRRWEATIAEETGKPPWQHVIDFVNGREHTTVLSLGAGACTHELDVAGWFTSSFSLDCLDMNEELLASGRAEGERRGIRVQTIRQDANRMELEAGRYDLVVAFSCLHHLVELEEVYLQVARALRPEGWFFVLDVTARNRMRLWPEALVVADALWELLPARLRRELTAPEGDKPVREQIPDLVAAGEGFECIRSEEVLPLLERFYPLDHLVKGCAFARQFLQADFGPNYDLEVSQDRQILEALWETDQRLVKAGLLRPGYFFAWARRSEASTEEFARAADEFHARGPEAVEAERMAPAAELESLRREVERLRWEVEGLRKSTSFRLGKLFVSRLAFLRRLKKPGARGDIESGPTG